MILKNFGLKNFKSYGNNRQDIQLTENGSVNLLVGRNGSGKTSLLQSLDFTFYRKVKGKNKKNISLSKIPNRLNKNLVSDATLLLDDDTEVKIVNGIAPDISEVYINDILDKSRDYSDYIDMSIDTFKSLVSVKFTDFMDFMSLSNDEKKMLISKLCDLEYLNNLSSKLPLIIRNNKEDLEKTEFKIKSIEKDIKTYSDTITKIIESTNNKSVSEVEDTQKLITRLEENEVDLHNKTEKLNELLSKKVKLEKYINNVKLKINTLKGEQLNLSNKLKLFESGKCAYCETKLDEAHNHNDIILDIKSKLDEIKTSIQAHINDGKAKSDLYQKILLAINKQNLEINSLNKVIIKDRVTYENIIESKKSLDNEKEDKTSILTKKLNELETELSTLKSNRKVLMDTASVHKKMQLVLGENGVKKQLISKLIDPVNSYIQEYIEKLELPFYLYIDSDLDVIINNNGYEIDSDTLSDGESRLLNLIIMLSYIKMTRKSVNLNILFLDEVFIFIDSVYIEKVVDIIKEFSYEYKLNTFLVHHSPLLNMGKFDNIIYIKKDYFSEISYGYEEKLL